MPSEISPFFYPGTIAAVDRLSIVHLKRDLQLPTVLKDHDEDDEGYTEGKVVNTRFGSFPHSTLLELPWGSQVRASKVDTGSRGRRAKVQANKRKREELDNDRTVKKARPDDVKNGKDASTPASLKEETEAVTASSGFVHLLPPTPENWTNSLPHRTQVVYTPDYSYILHRIRARPGSSLVEAGAGSGSFTHASARAVFNGYSGTEDNVGNTRQQRGKVWSYEFHEQRHEKLQKEISEHGLDGIVQITHRDVCENGFLVDGQSPSADAVFLDLPAPWLALPHLSRSRAPLIEPLITESSASNGDLYGEAAFISPLNPSKAVHLCTFSPCIEQVQKTVSVMRQYGWLDIEMVEVAAKRFEIRRERIGLENGGQRGAQLGPASVDEAVARLVEVEGIFRDFHENGESVKPKQEKENPNTKQKILKNLVEKKIYKEGKLAHRTEPEVKTHTSYLVFAILPREWSAEDEEKAAAKWKVIPREEESNGEVIGLSRRQQKKAEKHAKRENNRQEKSDHVQEDGQ